ncbi:MAG: N-acetylmuramoyl-L-alanine amidase [Desulfobacterales bacterium]|nr:N-acetylmuramoyl-L-alanine amidase [Desulfobacterales bacterium]
MPESQPCHLPRPIRGLWLSLILCLLATLFCGAAGAASNEVALRKQYDLAKAQFLKLQNAPQGESRDDWDRVVGGFRKIYLAAPKHELAAASLFMMGRIHHTMYHQFGNPLDFGEAVAYYQDVATLFPRNRLADDALYKLGRLYVAEKKDRLRAAKAFARVLNRYPRGDMADRAARQLALLGDVALDAAIQENGGKKKPAKVLPVRYWSSNNYTRVSIKTSAPVHYKERLLAASKNQPRRLFIDFADSRLTPEARFPVLIRDGLLKQVRAGQHTPDTVRVVLDIESISSYKIFTLQDPFRTVIDVMGKGKETVPVLTARVMKKRPGSKTRPGPTVSGSKASEPRLSLARQLGLGINRIVIDPGHGGKDPGAIAANGVMEKDVVLAVARKLADRLRRDLACEVVLTRTTDVFIPLEERTAIANTRKGDLFISLHVNSAPSPKVQGVETYLLDLTSNEDAMRLAAFENATSASNMSDLQGILAELLTSNKKDESARLAAAVQNSMAQGLKLRNLGVKRAPFYVLIGAQMPAILSEITFLSNPREAERLKRDSYLSAIAEQIAIGIAGYVNEGNVALLESR